MGVRMDLRLDLDADNLKTLEDMLARALARGILSAVRRLAGEGLLSGLAAVVAASPTDVEVAPPEPIAPVEPPTPAKRTRSPNRSFKEVCKTVEHRPEGYLNTERAREIIGGDMAQAVLRTWIFEKSVPAVIVASMRPPTKGLPGRLMVDGGALRQRNALRIRNRALPPTERRGGHRTPMERSEIGQSHTDCASVGSPKGIYGFEPHRSHQTVVSRNW